MTELLLDALGTPTRVWQYGDPEGAPVLMVHGFRGDHHGLEGIAREFVHEHSEVRVLVPDLPGFGETPPVPEREHDLALYGEWLRSLVRSLKLDRYVIVGHSFGSLVVANALAGGLAPQAAVLINPISAPALEGPQAVMTRLAVEYYRAADALPERPARALLGHPLIVRVMSEVMAKTHDRRLRRWIHAQHHSYFSTFSDTRTLLAAFRASVSHTVGEYSGSFHTPTLILAGERDDIAPLPAQLALHRRISSSQFVVLPGVGHLVHYEAVAPAVAEMASFLRQTVSQR